MKAFLLAAGIGSRLRPLTDKVPKCLVPIGDRPLLDIWLDSLDDAGVDEVLINLHYLPDMVTRHLRARTGPPEVRTVHEPELLGSAGTLLANRDWVQGDDLFLACYADNLTDFDLRVLIEEHRRHRPVATLTAFHSPNPSSGGVMDVDAHGLLVGFVEKPSQPASDLTNAGVYAFAPNVLAEIPRTTPQDIGYHLIPRLIGRARVVPIDGFFTDIGSPNAYRTAREEWPERALR
jgi:mannose-1-phosphate guanylyltransferase